MPEDTGATQAHEVRARLVEHLEDAARLVDALDPRRIDDDLWSSIDRVHESTGALLRGR